MILSPRQRELLKEHVYRAEGCSWTETIVLKHFWNWLTNLFPLWFAPNAITMAGLVVTLCTTLALILLDLKCQGEAPRWSYLLCAIGIFLYQTLDGCDGKQARRTGTSSALGEFFDHGCDVYATFFYSVAAVCIPGLIDYPYLMVALVVIVLQLNYTYHWQTYVCGVLYFKSFDIAEAQVAQISACLLTFFLGPEVWNHHTLSFLGIHYPLKLMFAGGTLFFGTLNLLSAYHVCLTRGVGKNGSTVADTSVLSPIITPLITIGMAVTYCQYSTAAVLTEQPVLFLTAFFFPMSKSVIQMMVAGMTKTPFPLINTILLGPLLACLNVCLSMPFPESYVLMAVAAYNIFDVTTLCVTLCLEISETLGVPLFTVPQENIEKLRQKNTLKN